MKGLKVRNIDDGRVFLVHTYWFIYPDLVEVRIWDYWGINYCKKLFKLNKPQYNLMYFFG